MEEVKKKRKRNVFDRIVLAPETQAVLTKLITELSTSTNGLLNLQRRELANFLIQSRSHSLDAKELSEIRSKFFDDAKAANWMVNQIREARSNGESVDLEELFKKVRMQSVDGKLRSARPPKERKTKMPGAPQVENELSVKASDAAIAKVDSAE